MTPGLESGPQVVTPGGPRSARLVYAVPAGGSVDVSGASPAVVDRSGRRTPVEATRPKEARPLSVANGWITWAWWVNDTPSPIRSFSTCWVVPPAPARPARQTVFLFNALTDAEAQHIVQPVLWWGASAAGGGSCWSAAAWHVNADGTVFHSPVVTLEPGQPLTGIMEVGAPDEGPRCICGFRECPQTELVITGLPSLVQATETLEAYGVTDASEYPATTRTTMAAIELGTGAPLPRIPWSVKDGSALGERTLVVSDAASGGAVDICYGPTGRA